MRVQPWIPLLLIGCGIPARAEEVMDRTRDIDSTSEDADVYIIGLFCILIAFFVSFIAIVIGYYSWLEDGLMKEYLQTAVVHEATVVSAEFSRAATTQEPTTSCAHSNTSDEHHHVGQSEYVARVEYRVSQQKSKQKIMVRKQVKVFASDFKKASGSSSDIPHAIAIEFVASFPLPDNEHDIESIAQGQEVEVLVMPGYSRSGLPRSQVLRTCSLSYRLPTVGLLLFLIFLAGACFYLGFQLAPFQSTSLATHELALLVLAVVLLAEMVLVVGCWGKTMREGVQQIYLEGGEFVKLAHDDTTISSGDDSYLRM